MRWGQIADDFRCMVCTSLIDRACIVVDEAVDPGTQSFNLSVELGQHILGYGMAVFIPKKRECMLLKFAAQLMQAGKPFAIQKCRKTGGGNGELDELLETGRFNITLPPGAELLAFFLEFSG
ncbi:MAG: hypothetical protein KKE95_13140 [Gammaproteobacteria bacterium]|nr:hypothetical protein [Gammaproteobacteria bacterium]